MKRYRLKKDLEYPGYFWKAGSEFYRNGDLYYSCNPSGFKASLPNTKWVELYPDWFEEIKEPERIEVTLRNYQVYAGPYTMIKDSKRLVVDATEEIPEVKGPAIKKAIEDVLNGKYHDVLFANEEGTIVNIDGRFYAAENNVRKVFGMWTDEDVKNAMDFMKPEWCEIGGPSTDEIFNQWKQSKEKKIEK